MDYTTWLQEPILSQQMQPEALHLSALPQTYRAWGWALDALLLVWRWRDIR